MRTKVLSPATAGSRAVLVLALACALPLAACGPGSSPASSPEPTSETATQTEPESTPVAAHTSPADATTEGAAHTSPADGTTQIVGLQVFGTDGYPTADWTITDRSTEPPFDCWSRSPAVLEGLGYMCGASVDYGVACLDNPLAADEVICVTDPIAQEGYRRKVGERPTGERTQFVPLAVEVADGGVFRMRSGGAGAQDPDGLVEFYFCLDQCDGTSLWGVAGEDGVDHDTDAWTALAGPVDGSSSAEEVAVTRAWMLVGTGTD